ncbi:MAG TPA: hypothetical protein DCP97_00460 [Ruminococcaceae bacterium]|nr:hypothetical protein [Oscillospiraceae bacterium]
MASTNKTEYLRLNSWLGTDKPKRDDFNLDNQILDSKIKEHFTSSAIHVTASEKASWNNTGYAISTYTGNGAVQQIIDLGFAPRCGIIFGVEEPPAFMDIITGGSFIFSGMFSVFGCSAGVYLEGSNLRVVQFADVAPDRKTPCLNQNGTTYVYIAFK